MPEVFCSKCEYYHPRSRLVNKGEINVSGGPVWYREWLGFCKNNHDIEMKDYHCKHYKPNAATRRRGEEFKLKIQEMENART